MSALGRVIMPQAEGRLDEKFGEMVEIVAAG